MMERDDSFDGYEAHKDGRSRNSSRPENYYDKEMLILSQDGPPQGDLSVTTLVTNATDWGKPIGNGRHKTTLAN